MKITEIETPALVLDREALLRNLQSAKVLAQAAGIALRPHYKSHRCPYLAKLQMEYGAKGITCAKVGEAEDVYAAGIRDILIANQVTVPSKIARLAKLAHDAWIGVCVDDRQNILDLEAAANREGVTLSVLVEFDVGMKRCGVYTNEEVLALTEVIAKQPHLRFGGIQAYAGQLSHEADFKKRMGDSEAIEEQLSQLKAFLTEKGLPPKEISGMSTGTLPLRQTLPTVYTESQAGSYLFMDAAYNLLDLPFENALFIFSSVISVNGDVFITDAGLKTCSVDQEKPVLMGHPEALVKLSEEHITNRLPGHRAKVNDTVRYIPGHCCTNVNLFDRIYLVSGDEVKEILPVTSRGKSQ